MVSRFPFFEKKTETSNGELKMEYNALALSNGVRGLSFLKKN